MCAEGDLLDIILLANIIEKILSYLFSFFFLFLAMLMDVDENVNHVVIINFVSIS
jgi:hypothetical protein